MYVPSTRNIISSYDFVFNESFSSTLMYMSQPHAEAMVMIPSMTHTHYATYSK